MYVHSSLTPKCSMINKNPETEIGVQPKGQKNKAEKQNKTGSYLYMSPPISYSSLVLGLTVCTNGIKSMHRPVSMVTSVATEI